ncbi:hypothetical protein G5I_01456 [Acromyrmex echinatior]|uniref:Uncharacterized protein n=1 Tax=Acromyrmex echinatior TaxID=103372 RepID=F4W7P0_ACREC|nr:hypothetical protein G5I_01456 [Acromyrmex echinatior]
MESIRKYNQTEESNHNYHHKQLYKHIEEKKNTTDILRNDHAIDDHSFVPDGSKDSSVRKDHNCDSSHATRDAQIQTSNKKNLRRRKIKRKSKPATEKISHRKHCNNEPRIVTDFRIGSHSSSRQSHHDEPWLRVRVLENKRAEYINKFTTVNRQIEEITATLRDTCCSSESSRNNLENCDEYFSSISDDTKVNWSGVENKSTIKDLAENLVDLKESRYHQKIFEEKVGEVAILEDIKRRIDRDFDDPPGERSENDTEDFFTVSQKSSNFNRENVDVPSVTIIEKSKSTPLIVATNLKPTKIQIHSSMSVGAMNECSNKNSALSKYFSCTQIPSLVSLTENEDELAVKADDSMIESHSNYHYYDSRSNFSLNNYSLSNLDSSLDCSCSSFEYISRYDPFAQYVTPNKSLIEMVNKSDDTFEISEGRESVAKNRIFNWEHPPLEESGEKEWRTRKQYTADSTFETSKSSRYVGSIDSGVFSSSLIDLYPAEKSFYTGKSKFEKKRRAEKLDGLSTVVDSGSDSSCTNDTLDRKVNDVVRDLTKNLILCERRAKMKLRARDTRYSKMINLPGLPKGQARDERIHPLGSVQGNFRLRKRLCINTSLTK